MENIDIFKKAILEMDIKSKNISQMLNSLRENISYRWDKLIIELQYWKIFRQKINWDNPQTYTEKMQLLKLAPESEKLWIYADKYEVRKFVRKTIGSQYLNKLYGVYQNAEEIDLNALPNKFILKPTHGSGPIIICKNKADLNWPETKKILNRWLKKNYYHKFKEKSYKLIKPKIICERYLEDKQGNLYDYKFFCFHGKSKFIQVDLDRYVHHTQNFYTPSWRKLPLARCFPVFKKPLKKPSNLKKMLKIASSLSANFPHVRIDLYNVDNHIYFGEMTFTSFAGNPVFKPKKYDYIIGKYFKLKT